MYNGDVTVWNFDRTLKKIHVFIVILRCLTFLQHFKAQLQSIRPYRPEGEGSVLDPLLLTCVRARLHVYFDRHTIESAECDRVRWEPVVC